MMKKTIRDFDLTGKRVLIRCDFNVPMQDGKITDDNRIVQSLETINYAINKKAKVILLSHLGKVKSESDKKKNSLRVVGERLSELLNKNVIFINDTRGLEVEAAINNMHDGEVILLENTRWEDYPEKLESKNDDNLGKYWAKLGDIYINDAFGTAHRSHASNVGISKYLPSGIGFLIEKELKELSVLNNPSRPYVVILGGAKISDKIEIISAFVEKADKILIGGGMAFTFLKAKGYEVGKSLVDIDNLNFALDMINNYDEKIILPIDIRATKEFTDTNHNRITSIDSIKEDEMGLDIGPDSINLFMENLKNAKTIFWNGTLGYSEYVNYCEGTKNILKFISSLDATVILGGGDTVAASKIFGYKDKVSYASTGGGATLEYIAGKTLPGLEAIDNK